MELRTSHSFLIIFHFKQVFIFLSLYARMCTPKGSLLCHSLGTVHLFLFRQGLLLGPEFAN